MNAQLPKADVPHSVRTAKSRPTGPLATGHKDAARLHPLDTVPNDGADREPRFTQEEGPQWWAVDGRNTMSTHEHGNTVLKDLREPAKELRSRIPEVYDGYAAMHKAALADGSLDGKTKELIALAIAVSKECDGCIASHARGAARTGATADEVADALGVAILMNGGPATVFGPRAMDAFLEFEERYSK